jgi:hypothetical protein
MVFHSILKGLIILILLKYLNKILYLFQLVFIKLNSTLWLIIRRRVAPFVMFKRKLKSLKMSNNQNDNLDSIKMFEYIRIRPVKTKKNKLLKASQTDKIATEELSESDSNRILNGVPKRRSGHRAVCNDKYLYIWGGYSPSQLEGSDIEDENANPNASPLYPEVFFLNQTK